MLCLHMCKVRRGQKVRWHSKVEQMVTHSESCVGLFFILWPEESEAECNNSHFLPGKIPSQVAEEYEEGDITCLGILT